MQLGMRFIFLNIFACSAFGFFIAPLINNLGNRFNILDFPDPRKIHKKPIVRIGGLTIILTFLLFNLVNFVLFKFTGINIYESQKILIIFIGALFYFLLGLHDDIYRSSPLLRLLIQFSIAFILSLCGFSISNLNVNLPFLGLISFTLPVFWSHVVTCFWIVGLTNAINWLDGLDGLASGYSFFVSIALLISSAILGNTAGIVFFSILSGSIIGFLIRNFKPAFYIMGDCGSYFLGFCLSLGSIYFPSKASTNSLPILFLLSLFSLPILDMLSVISLRLYRKKNPLKPDRNHIHHKMIRAYIPYKYIISLIYSFSFLSTMVATLFLE